MRKSKTQNWFEARISKLLSRNPNIHNIHELAICALRNQMDNPENNFALDCALSRMMVEKRITFKKPTANQITLSPISIAA